MDDDARHNEELISARRAAVLGMSYVDTTTFPKNLFPDILPLEELYHFRVVPLRADAHHIDFGVTTTTSQQTIKHLTDRFTDQRTSFSIISDSGYKEYMAMYDPPRKVEYEDIAITEKVNQSLIDEVSATLERVRPDDMLAYLVQQAYKLTASDIHLETDKERTRVRFRIDGVLHSVAYINIEKYRHLLAAIASAANVSTNEKEAQTGHISRAYTMATGEAVTLNLRVETVNTVYGMDIVMRIFNMKLENFKLANLGLSDKEAAVVDDVINHPTGLVLVVGPTGSGKTTTLYSIINTLNSDERKIITLEDPVEYNMPGVVQIPVEGTIEGHSFAQKLRAVLRLDPDVVMVGEIRDQDTAKTALQGALTGHLVLSTFHAASAAAALARMLDMVGANPLLINAIHLVMAQRLVRRLDDATKQAYTPDAALKAQLKAVIDTFPVDMERPDIEALILYKPGSSATNPFGFQGQLALREQLTMTPPIQELLKNSAQINVDEIEKTAVGESMRTMLHDGVSKALAGLTTIEEVYRVTG